jgi:hypothetical protein
LGQFVAAYTVEQLSDLHFFRHGRGDGHEVEREREQQTKAIDRWYYWLQMLGRAETLDPTYI